MVRALAGAIFGVILASTLPVLEGARWTSTPFSSSIDDGLAQLEAGFPL